MPNFSKSTCLSFLKSRCLLGIPTIQLLNLQVDGSFAVAIRKRVLYRSPIMFDQLNNQNFSPLVLR